MFEVPGEDGTIVATRFSIGNMGTWHARFIYVFSGILWLFSWDSPSLEASTLYTMNVQGNGNFLSVNQETGLATALDPDGSLGLGSWNGLTSVPGQSDILFAVNNPRPATIDDPQFSRLASIDPATGDATLFPLFDMETLGRPEVFSTAIAVSVLDTAVAVVAGFDRSEVGTRVLWKVSLETGEVLGPAVMIEDGEKISAMTYSLDGSTLYGTGEDGQLVTIDPDTGDLTEIGDPGLQNSLEGLAFRPSDGALFAINAQSVDRLVILDPEDGSFVSELGRLEILGPEGLAFLPPEGDLDGNGVLDLSDFAILKANLDTGSTPEEGDLNGDGAVDIDDFNILKQNFGKSAPINVPEPATAGLAWLALLVFVLFGRRITNASRR